MKKIITISLLSLSIAASSYGQVLGGGGSRGGTNLNYYTTNITYITNTFFITNTPVYEVEYSANKSISGPVDIQLEITNAISGNLNILLTNVVPGFAGSLFLLSDASVRTIKIFSNVSVTPMDTNFVTEVTNIVTTANKRLMIGWTTRRESATKTNILYGAVSQP